MSRREPSRAAALKAALAQLPEGQRAVFHAVAIEGASNADAAKRLGMTTADVEGQLAAALVALDKEVGTPPRQSFWQRLTRRFGPGPDG